MFKSYNKVIIGAALLIVGFFIAINTGCIDLSAFMQANDNSIHFNLLTVGSVIAGFLFTGLSVLISVGDKKIVREYNKTDIMQSIYSNILSGIVFNLISIIFVIIILLNIRVAIIHDLKKWLVYIEVLSLILGLWCFTLSVFDLKFIIDSIKESDKKVPEDVMNRVRDRFNNNKS